MHELKNILKKIIIFIIKKFSLEERLSSINKMVNHTDIKLQEEDRVMDYFTDSFGERYELIEGLRNRIKPGWEEMLKEKEYGSLPSNENILNQLNYVKQQFIELEKLMTIHSVQINNKMDILEVGASHGAMTYQIASKNPKTIVGSDYNKYQINQTNVKKGLKNIIKLEDEHANRVRNKIGSFFEKNSKNIISFINDDICNSKIDSNSKDLILSWETLEHLSNPLIAFQEMFRILKPGGFAFHQYNPFFSFNGGHSLCTLDFMWGHARLSFEDFEKYIIKFRPNEYELAMEFYKENLNRMTIRKLNMYIKRSGFDYIMFFPNVYLSSYYKLDEKIYKNCKKNYPSIEILDLVSPSISIGIRKPNL